VLESPLTERAVRSGVYLPPFGPFGDPVVLVDLAVRAERAGWDGVFLWDHLVHDDLPVVDPWSTLAAIAQATERILLGPMVTPLARRRPWVVARQAATISRLSGGRLILGTGLGSDESGDFSRFDEPADLPERAARYDEGIDIVRGVWSGLPYRHEGPHHRVELGGSPPVPHPIPVWVASSTGSTRVLRRAARCDGIFPNPQDHTPTPNELRATIAALHEAGLPAGRPFDVAVAGNNNDGWGEPPTVDVAALAAAGMTWWMESLIHFDPLELSLRVVDAGPNPI
jgi:alkanesulfonate monooxygenase SsuD/methylene tetrahydromethanopterin reductase-like flavin-dependent oxidoreductase (luciferase family)